jgi:hypothetical protein
VKELEAIVDPDLQARGSRVNPEVFGTKAYRVLLQALGGDNAALQCLRSTGGDGVFGEVAEQLRVDYERAVKAGCFVKK